LNARAIVAWSANCRHAPAILPSVSCWSRSSRALVRAHITAAADFTIAPLAGSPASTA
jgi:hypothetical protein